METKEIELKLTVAEVNGVLSALGQMPFAQVSTLIQKIQQQAAPQVQAFVAPAEEYTGSQIMENQQFINLFLGIGLTVMGWFARELWAAVKDLKTDLAKLRENLPKDYIAKDDYKEDIREIKSMLAKIFEKLENKADK